MIDTYDCWPTLTRSYDYKSIHLAGSLFMNTHFILACVSVLHVALSNELLNTKLP